MAGYPNGDYVEYINGYPWLVHRDDYTRTDGVALGYTREEVVACGGDPRRVEREVGIAFSDGFKATRPRQCSH